MPAPPVVQASDAQRRALFAVFLRAASRRFNLVEVVPQRFVARGWELDDRVHIATLALAFVAMRRPLMKIQVFRGADDPPCWAKIVGFSSAQDIVEALELRDLIPGAG
jgi:hypothetical protein